MFDKGFSNIEKLKRFEKLKKLGEIYYAAKSLASLNRFFALNTFSFKTFTWFKQGFFNRIIESFNGNS